MFLRALQGKGKNQGTACLPQVQCQGQAFTSTLCCGGEPTEARFSRLTVQVYGVG